MKVYDKIFLEGVEIAFRNFRGLENEYNAPGDRNFLIMLEPGMAADLSAAGWNVKQLKAKNEGEEPGYCLKAKVNFRYDEKGHVTSPNIWMVSEHGKTLLNDQTVGRLDTAEIKNVDVELSPYNWERQGRSGVTAYVNRMVVTIAEDRFSSKYYNLENDVDETLEDGLPWS